MLLRIFTEPQQGATYDQLLGIALAAEASGFDAFFRSDHYLRMGAGDPGPGPSDAWTTLAGLARDTSTIRLGTLVSSMTFRYPGVLAIQVANVDAMSNGRVELGLGSGWFAQEHTAYGIEFPALGERFDRLEEQLAILRGLWTTAPGDTFTFEGAHYQLRDSPALPKPVQQPHPPIVIGGGGPKRTPRLAATYGAEYNLPFQSPEATAQPSSGCEPRATSKAATPMTSSTPPPSSCVAARPRPRSSVGPVASDASRRSSARTAPPGARRKCSTSWLATPRSAPTASTSRCST